MNGASGRRRVRWGQNFLIDKNVARRIVDFAQIDGCDVIEIGPGRAILTELLLERCRSLSLVEIDPVLAAELEDKYGRFEHVAVHQADALSIDPAIFASRPLHLIGNLPYETGTTIVTRALREFPGLQSATVMLQKEVVDRIAATHGGKDYGRLSLDVQVVADVRRGPKVSAHCFRPPPRVESEVVRLDLLSRPRHGLTDLDVFSDLVRVAFATRRKMIRNTVVPWLKGLGHGSQVEALLAKVEIDPTARAETVSLEQFAALALAISRNMKPDA